MQALIVILIFAGTTQVLALAPARNLHFCKTWNCINEKVGLTQENGISTFDRNDLKSYLTSVLPEAWEKSIDDTLNTCLSEKKPRRYAVTCPGQETWHCIVDQLVDNCPENNLQKDNACTPIASLVGASYLFYQSSYVNIDREIQNDRRPPTFLRNNYRTKCCELPSIFNTTVLSECRVATFMKVQPQPPVHRTSPLRPTVSTEEYCSEPTNEELNPLECCDTSDLVPPNVFHDCGVDLKWEKDKRLIAKDKETEMTTTEAPVTAKTSTKKHHRTPDVKVVPVSCSGVTCVFRKLSIVLPDGTVDRDAFSRLLDNVTRDYPAWSSARARVLTRCLKRNLNTEYDGCDINKLVACTLDVFSENCPNKKKGWSDPCRHSATSHNTTVTCQVSTSKFQAGAHGPPTTTEERTPMSKMAAAISQSAAGFACLVVGEGSKGARSTAIYCREWEREGTSLSCVASIQETYSATIDCYICLLLIMSQKNRHRYCDVPRLVPQSSLQECGLTALSHMISQKQESTTTVPKKKYQFKLHPTCINISNSTKCILDKLGILNKYKYMDYNKMKELVDNVAGKRYSWTLYKTRLQDALRLMPKYGEFCTSTRKLLNVMDAAVMNCPFSKRKYTAKCSRFFGHLQRCSNDGRPATVKPHNLYTPVVAKPLLFNINFLNTNRSVHTAVYAPAYTHTVVTRPKYSPKFSYYTPTIHNVFTNSRKPSFNSNFGIFPTYPPNPNLGQPFSSVYNPIFSHDYIHPVSTRPMTYGPYYYRNNFRSLKPLNDKPVQGQHLKKPEIVQLNQAAVSPLTPLKHLMPVDGQVFE